jgi:hypothetical protein
MKYFTLVKKSEKEYNASKAEGTYQHEGGS